MALWKWPIIEASNNVMLDSKNNYIYSNKKIVTAVGVENLVVVDTEDALLICKKDESQKVKELVETLKQKGLEKYL
ncbi:MAG: hypothetical protein P8Y99_05795 [Calditrichaceae bacterium]